MSALMVVVATVVGVGLLLLLARKLIPGETKAPHHDVAAAIFSMVGVLYAVILAFVVIVVWENDSQATNDAQVEANDVSRLYFTARAMPEPQRSTLMKATKEYADNVAHVEWKQMTEGETSARAQQLVAGMRASIQGLQPANSREEILMNNALEAVNELVEARRARTAKLTSPVSPPMWAGLIAGSVITIGFTFFFDHARFTPHLIMVGSMSALIAFTLWLVYDMSLPFSGAGAQGPDAFVQVLQRFNEFP